jgi:Fe-coproporphyrin III synthase
MRPTGDSAILQVHPTRRCNLRCLHCYSSSGPTETQTLPVGLLAAAVRDAAGLGYGVLSVSGGEPLLYSGLPELLAAAREAGMRTTLTTNGTVLTAARLAAVRDLVDLVAVSLDGTAATHDRIRGRAGAHPAAVAALHRLAAAGVSFGVITTLTAGNVAEFAEVAATAAEAGAALLQVHPLEPEGAAREHLAGELPDRRELGFAAVEVARVARELGLPAQFDAVPRPRFVANPAAFLADPGDPGDPLAGRLGDWLSPLVVEADGAVVPLSHGLHRRFAIGDLHRAPLAELAAAWDPAPLRRLCRDTWLRLVREAPPLVPWYDELVDAARRPIPVRT